MAPTPDTSNHFVLEVFDRTLWCPTAQAPFYPRDVGPLRSILGLGAANDTELKHIYYLDDDQIAAIVSAFGTFDPRQLDDEAEIEIRLFRLPGTIETPYLVHTNWELPLLLEGRKKLAHFLETYPKSGAYMAWALDREEAFDRWVARGLLHKEVVDERFEEPKGGLLGHRTVYYIPRGEEWRIPAHKLIKKASGKSGGWNEHFERLEGMLFGYEDWQNDWWIKYLLEQGHVFGGATYCCAVSAAGLAWAESSGLRALPPIEPCLPVMVYPRNASGADLTGFLREQSGAVAVLRFTAAPYAIRHIIDMGDRGPWKLPEHQVAELNKHLKGAIVVVARCGQST